MTRIGFGSAVSVKGWSSALVLERLAVAAKTMEEFQRLRLKYPAVRNESVLEGMEGLYP